MNYLFLITFGFAFLAMLHLSRRIESQLHQLGKQPKHYEFEKIEDGVYSITPCPVNPVILQGLSNVIWIEVEDDKLLIKCERLNDIEDLIITLNSTCI
jgi:hypothetical protein